MECGFKRQRAVDNGKLAASSFQNSLKGGDPGSIVSSSFQNSPSGNSSSIAGSFQNTLADASTISTIASSCQNPLAGGNFTCSACEPSTTAQKGGISDGDFETTSRKHPKIYCSHCEEYISKSSWYEHYSKFYKPSTKTWGKGKITKPLPFNFNEESVNSDECPVMEESCDQIYDETNSSSTDAFDEMMHPESQVRSCIYLF